jgi:hypothetical protein
MTICNQSSKICETPSTHSVIMFAVLPIPIKDHNVAASLRRVLYIRPSSMLYQGYTTEIPLYQNAYSRQVLGDTGKVRNSSIFMC